MERNRVCIISRRGLLKTAAVLGGASVVPLGLSAPTSAEAVYYIPYIPRWALPSNLAGCNEFLDAIKRAQSIRDELPKSNSLIDAFISANVERKNRLSDEISFVKAQIDGMERALVVQKIGIVVSLTFLVAGALVSTPVAVGALLGLEIIGGTAMLGFQAIYAPTSTPTLVAAYTKDRLLVFGGPIAENAGSAGGRILAKAVSVASVAVDVYGVDVSTHELGHLREKLKFLVSEAEGIRAALSKFPPTARGPWRGIYDTILEDTIASMQSILSTQAASDCRFEIKPAGPILQKP